MMKSNKSLIVDLLDFNVDHFKNIDQIQNLNTCLDSAILLKESLSIQDFELNKIEICQYRQSIGSICKLLFWHLFLKWLGPLHPKSIPTFRSWYGTLWYNIITDQQIYTQIIIQKHKNPSFFLPKILK